MSHHDHDDDVVTNTSANPHIMEIAEARFTRRQTLFGGLSATTAALFGSLSLAGCDDDDNEPATPPAEEPIPTPKLSFVPVPKSTADVLTVPDGYTAQVLYSLGDPIKEGVPAWADNGSETGASYVDRAGDHHDGMYFFGLAATGTAPDPKSSDRGILCMNHEALTTTYLHAAGETRVSGKRTVPDECIKEMNAHGVSVIEVKKNAAGKFAVNKGSLNRRITTFTEMELSGPVRGDSQVVTKFSTNGTKTRGTVNNCANGYTPWGTYLTCEENWAGYFARAADDNSKRTGDIAKQATSLARYGNAQGAAGRHLWETAGADDQFARWITGVTGDAATADYRNVINTFGFVVEIDPYDTTKTPKKRTALGRFAHEGCWPGPVKAGKPVVFYMGDDNRGDYIYKFVSTANWDPADANKADRMAVGDKYMDSGKLYVAKFNANGTGEWVELTFDKNGLNAASPNYPFANQADVCLNSRLAGDAVGATKMDRPEWGAVNPINGEVYLTLTNNSNRGSASQPVNAANPRNYDADTGSTSSSLNGNVNGHIIRWHEDGDSPAATTFEWDIYLFGSRSTYPADVNLSNLGANNDLSSPDGLWFDPRGVLWIQTDDGAYTDTTNCMMLAAAPGAVGDGGDITVAGQTTYKGKNPTSNDLRRFLVGPRDCEITGIAMTPDGKTMFVNIQHPGESGSLAAPLSHWPDGGVTRPRSSTVVVTRDDGGVIGI